MTDPTAHRHTLTHAAPDMAVEAIPAELAAEDVQIRSPSILPIAITVDTIQRKWPY